MIEEVSHPRPFPLFEKKVGQVLMVAPVSLTRECQYLGKARHGPRSGASTGYVPFPFFLTTEQPSDDSFFLNWPHDTSVLIFMIGKCPKHCYYQVRYTARIEL